MSTANLKLISIFAFFSAGLATTSRAAELTPQHLWSKPLGAHPSHVSASSNGKFILVSTSDPGQGLLFDPKGKILWKKSFSQAVKSQAISSTGEYSAFCNYDAKLRVYSKSGKLVFETDGFGKILFVKRPDNKDKIVVFNDDDSEVHSAFSIYDLKGNVVAKPKVDSESVDFFISPSRDVLIALSANNQLLAFDTDGKPLWQVTDLGNTIKAAVTESKSSRSVFLLTDTLGAYDVDKKSYLWSIKLERKLSNLQLIENALVGYSNNNDGQRLEAYSKIDGKLLWTKSYPNKTSYFQVVHTYSKPAPLVIAPFEVATPAGTFEFWGISAAGAGLWKATVTAANGIFSYAASEFPKLLAIADGEPGKGTLEVFGIK